MGAAGVTDPGYNVLLYFARFPTGNGFVTFFLVSASNRLGSSDKDFACVPLKPLRSIAAPTSNHTASAAVRCRLEKSNSQMLARKKKE